MEQGGSAESLESNDARLKVKTAWDYHQMRFFRIDDPNDRWIHDYDFEWQPDGDEGQLLPKNGLLAIIHKKFKDVTVSDLRSANYLKDPIISDRKGDQLKEDTVIAIKTRRDNYAKMVIGEYVPREYKESLRQRIHRYYRRIQPYNIPKYHMKVRIVLYEVSLCEKTKLLLEEIDSYRTHFLKLESEQSRTAQEMPQNSHH